MAHMRAAIVPGGILWIGRHPDWRPEDLGFIAMFLDRDDPRDAKAQFDARYGYGGYWQSGPASIDEQDRLLYPGDPPSPPLAEARLRDERIILYPYEFIAVIGPDGFAVQRMD
jgi:hypothetical protein